MHPDRLCSTDALGENPAPPTADQGSASCLQTNQYAQLKRLIKQNGLLDRQPAYYTGKTAFTLGLLAVLGVLIASALVTDASFGADHAWRYVTYLTVGYLISRGLAKAGSREPYQN